MKKLKKIMALALSFMMIVAMSVVAFAASTPKTYTLTITGTKTGHTYNVYQIFTGDVSDVNGTKTLSNVKYGASYVPAGKSVGDAVDAADLQNITDADQFATDFVTNYVKTNAVTPFKTVQSQNGSTQIDIYEPDLGYYLIMDASAVTGQDAVTKYILQVIGDTTVAVKSDVPTVEKKVKENAKTTNAAGTETDTRIPGYQIPSQYNDVADYNIGDKVPFQLIGTLPSNYEDYTTYKYYFHDTLSTGLTYNANSIHIYVKNGQNAVEVKSGFVSTITGTSLEIKAENLNALQDANGETIFVTKDSYIVVDYNATLNSEAVIGLPGNPNEVYLEFSNNPNEGGDGETGSTPKDEVIVFTYELDVTKVETGNETNKLKDAEFKLKNEAGKWVQVNTDGKVTGWVDNETEGSTLKSDDNGLFKVIGLDDGKYFLKETKAPVGYNLLKDEVEFTVTATTANNQTWNGKPGDALTKLEITVAGKATDGNTDTGIVGMNVKNSKGSTLPTTGGMGTTIFYVVGSVLVLGAVILLITKKRMSAR